ncbi:9494_t:CDS:2, partial [Acaulospora colombiana]
RVQEKASETGGEITVNLFLLTALGGQYDPASYSSPKYAPSNHVTSYDVRKLISHPSITAPTNAHQNPNSLAALKAASEVSPAKIDILLTHIPPASIALHTPNVPKELESPIAPPFDDIVRAAMPRYHFVSRPGIFWERDPFGWPAQWSYAFSIVPITPHTALPPLPANATYNPYIPHEASKSHPISQPSPPAQKRHLPEDDGPQFRWSNEGRDGAKRRRTETQAKPVSTLAAFVARQRVMSADDAKGLITLFEIVLPRMKPVILEEESLHQAMSAEPVNRVEREKTRAKGPPKEIRGQLPVTNSDDPKMKELFPVPGGGELLIIPISHYPTLRSLPADEAGPTLAEIDRYGSLTALPLIDIMILTQRMLHRVHAQLHVIPVPNSIPHDEVESLFHQISKQLRIELKEGAEELEDVMDNYVSIELPSGKTLVHIIDEES